MYKKILFAAFIMIMTSLILRGCKDHLNLVSDVKYSSYVITLNK